MATLYADWICDEGGVLSAECYALWGHCEVCHEAVFPFHEGYYGGLVIAGNGLKVEEYPGNRWYEFLEELRDRFDICSTCVGSGGGYYCGFHNPRPAIKGAR